MPVLFVGHGSPMNAIERNRFHLAWEALGRRMPRPRAILCVSAHWETRNAHVTATETPETIHDFYGFPKALFDVRYPAPGDPALARRVAELVDSERVRLDPGRGLDHGAWSVLAAMYPGADVPVVQLSMDTTLPGRHHLALARQLAPLRDEGVLVLASGNWVHNLRLFNFRDTTPLDWALRCDAEIRGLVEAGRHEALADYPSAHDDARLAVPTPEHYLPLLYAIALQQPGETAEFFNAAVVGPISMTSVLIQGPAKA
jgi:4,5-DOPA dioxygenase extradiol